MTEQNTKLKYIGTIVNTKGYDGKLILRYLLRDSINIKPKSPVFIGFSESFSREYTLNSWKNARRQAVLTLQEINSDTDARDLKEKGLFVSEEFLMKDDKLMYDPDEIVGYKALNAEDGSELGYITDVWILPGNDVWVIESDEYKLPVPVIDDVIVKIERNTEEVQINLIEGLNEIRDNKKR